MTFAIVKVFPEPVTPIIPRVFPAGTVNDTLFKSFEIELFKNKFILFDSGFNVKSLNNTKEIDVPKSDEGKKYYIITEDILELKEVMNKNRKKELDLYKLYANEDEFKVGISNSIERILSYGISI